MQDSARYWGNCHAAVARSLFACPFRPTRVAVPIDVERDRGMFLEEALMVGRDDVEAARGLSASSDAARAHRAARGVVGRRRGRRRGASYP
eukprot:15442215-Alexandrium_andersonii.AAC.1